MIYGKSYFEKPAEPKEFCMCDAEIHELLTEAERRYQAFLLEAFMGDRRGELTASIEKVHRESERWTQELPTRYKPIAALPALLADNFKKHLYE